MDLGKDDFKYAYYALALKNRNEKDSAEMLIKKIENKTLAYKVAHEVFQEELERLGVLSIKEMEEPLTEAEDKEQFFLREQLNLYFDLFEEEHPREEFYELDEINYIVRED